MLATNFLDDVLTALPKLKDQHARTSSTYSFIERIIKREIENFFEGLETGKKVFGPFGSISFPFFRMGAISSKDLFGLDELILFSYYWVNRENYRRVIDIGANIGLHSLLLAKCGFEVEAFEPDPIHFQKLKETMKLNSVSLKETHCAAVSNKSGKAEFVRVLGNTTSNHLAGAKQPYGELERFEVPLFNIKDLIKNTDLIKMDVEGHEGEILIATVSSDWNHTDAFVEIGTPVIAEQVFNHFRRLEVGVFSQKIGWEKVKKLDEMPTSYKEGSIFISKKEGMKWT